MARCMWRLGTAAALPFHGTSTRHEAPSADVLRLRYVQAAFRHGARTPISSLPFGMGFGTGGQTTFQCSGRTSLLSFRDARGSYEKTFVRAPLEFKLLEGECLRGQLTDVGRGDMNQLGAWLRKRYIHQLRLLPDQFDRSTVRVRSTDVPRTLESVVCLLESLYPPATTRKPDERPIPIQARRGDDENMYPRVNCASLDIMKTIARREQSEKNMSRREKITDDLWHLLCEGKSHQLCAKKAVSRFEGVHNTLRCYLHNRMKLPGGVDPPDEELLDRIHKEAANEMSSKFGSIQILRLAIGLFVGDLLHLLKHSAMRIKHGDDVGYRLDLFSGHDNTVGPLWLALHADPSHDEVRELGEFPRFACNVLIELYNDDLGRLWVRGLSNGREMDLPDSIENSDGWKLVPFEKFIDRMQRLAPSHVDYVDACNARVE